MAYLRHKACVKAEFPFFYSEDGLRRNIICLCLNSYMKQFGRKVGFVSAFIIPLLVVAGFYLGGAWNFLALIFSFILFPRLDRLAGMRYDQSSMSDPERVSEYDFASNALITELLSMAESRKEYLHNPTLQKLVDSIRAADQRVMTYRESYDQVASRFNRFIERNEHFLQQVDSEKFEKKPLFQMAAE